jgi:tRNA modification GTPase
MSDRNIAAILTPSGAAAIAVIRISGPNVRSFLTSHFSRSLTPLRCVHGDLRDGERILDDAVVVLHENGLTADINVHGGPWVVTSVLELLKRSGFEEVDPTPDLLDGDTILQREVHASLPLAKTEEGVRMLLAQPAAWERFVASNPSPEAIRAVAEDQTLERLLHPPRVAIVGAPNVGKSTLANQLFAQQRSITADVPGTTRDWVGEIANIDGLPVMLVDTPGRRETDDHIERAAIDRSRKVIAGADVVLIVREPFQPDGGFEYTSNTIIVMNKLDKFRRIGMGIKACWTVATTGEGVDQLRTEICQALGCADLTPDRPRCWTDRQREALHRNPRDVLVGHK